jgi:NADH dehydrogenase
LKTVEDAVAVRANLLAAFEAAEIEPDPARRKQLLTFAIIGGGPTGVEMAGALSELARVTMKSDYRNFRIEDVEVVLIEAGERILPAFPAGLATKAAETLNKLGVRILTGVPATHVSEGLVAVGANTIETETVVWAAGVKASSWGGLLRDAFGARLDASGRVHVGDDLTIPGHANVFVIGDLARMGEQRPLGVAPVAIQQGNYAGRLIASRIAGRPMLKPFAYRNKGNLAVIGRGSAIAHIGKARIAGSFAWLIWAFVHIFYLIGFDSKLKVMLQWGWNYLTNARSTRLITAQPQNRLD